MSQPSAQAAPAMAAVRRRPRWRKRLAGVILGSTVAVLMVEILVRGLGLDVPRVWEPDAHLGWHHIPGATRHFTEEGDGWIEINSLGYRDRERSLARTDDTFRIMVLGDSMTEAAQVDWEDSYCAHLERRLNDEGRRVEVLNCGVVGYSPLQELLLLQREGRRFQPDLVMVGLFLDNDVADLHPELCRPLKDTPFAKLVDGRLDIDYSRAESGARDYVRQPIYFIRKWSATYRWIRSMSSRQQAGAAANGPSDQPPLRFMVYADPAPPVWEEAWSVMEKTLLELAEETRRLGAQFVIVSLPCGQASNEQVWIDLLEKHGAMRELHWDLDQPERRLAAFADKHQLRLCQLLPNFRERAGDEALFFGSIGHFNQQGHRLATEVIADYLTQQRLLPHSRSADVSTRSAREAATPPSR
jgi:hypothetical protein